MKTAEFGKPVTHLPEPGTCRICGCTEDHACLTEVEGVGQAVACAWADHTRTLCDAPPCIAEAKRELGFVEGCDGGHGRTSIKQSHRAEGRNFVG